MLIGTKGPTDSGTSTTWKREREIERYAETSESSGLCNYVDNERDNWTENQISLKLFRYAKAHHTNTLILLHLLPTRSLCVFHWANHDAFVHWFSANRILYLFIYLWFALCEYCQRLLYTYTPTHRFVLLLFSFFISFSSSCSVRISSNRLWMSIVD